MASGMDQGRVGPKTTTMTTATTTSHNVAAIQLIGSFSIDSFMEGYGHGKLKVVAGRLGRVYAAAAKFKSFSNNTAAAVVASCTFVKTKMSLRYAREHLLLAFDDAMISEEEFVLLFDHNKSSNLDLRYDQYPLFDLDDMEDDECLAEFRVRKRDIPLLEEALQIPEEFTLEQRSVVGGTEGLCMLLKRLTYPCRYGDMLPRFGRPVSVLCMATNWVLDHIYAIHHRRINHWNAEILSPAALQVYADIIHQKGAPLQNCFGFIDGTVRPIARPGTNQRIMYNGHKRVHSLKFQAVAIPNGLIAHLYGPVGM